MIMFFVSATIAVFFDNWIRGWGPLLLLLDEEASAEVRINISLTWQPPIMISQSWAKLVYYLHISNFGKFGILASNLYSKPRQIWYNFRAYHNFSRSADTLNKSQGHWYLVFDRGYLQYPFYFHSTTYCIPTNLTQIHIYGISILPFEFF